MAEVIVVVMGLLALGFLGTRVADVLRIPHSVFLVVAGIATAIVLRAQPGLDMGELEHLFPEIILYILLPPLIFESAYNFDIHELRRDVVPISALAVLSLLVSTFVVGYGLHWWLGLPLLPALVFGALISATDPVAVVALFKAIGAPKRLNSLVEGESLLNDGTAIVLFRVLLAFVAVPVFDAQALVAGVGAFVQVAVGGVLVGAVVAGLVSLALRFTSTQAAAQLGLTVAAAYLSFLLADHAFHVSGVIATMTVGLFLGSRARLELNKEALHGMRHVWEFMSLAANTLVFFGVGLVFDPEVLLPALLFVVPTLVLVYAGRAVSVVGVVPLVNLTRWAKPISLAYQTILVWGGLRGGLALALVLTLPSDFPHKQLFLALAMAVVLATLLVNALTIKPLMGWLGLNRLNPVDDGFYRKTMGQLGSTVFGALTRAAGEGALSESLVHEKQAEFVARTGHSSEEEATDRVFALYTLLLTEKRYYDDALEDGILSRSAYTLLCRTVAERQSVLDLEGWEALEASPLGRVAREGWRRWAGTRINDLVLQLEVPLNQRLALSEAAHGSQVPTVRRLADRWLAAVSEQLAEFYTHYPSWGIGVQSVYIARTVKATAGKTLEELQGSGIISGAVAAQARQNIDSVHALALAEARGLFRPTVATLLARVPLFRGLPTEALATLAARVHQSVVPKSTVVVRQGDAGRSFFLVTAGFLEVSWSTLAPDAPKPRLFVGDYFGEVALVFGQTRGATVTAVIDSVLIEIDRGPFEELLGAYPEVRDDVLKTAEARRHG